MLSPLRLLAVMKKMVISLCEQPDFDRRNFKKNNAEALQQPRPLLFLKTRSVSSLKARSLFYFFFLTPASFSLLVSFASEVLVYIWEHHYCLSNSSSNHLLGYYVSTFKYWHFCRQQIHFICHRRVLSQIFLKSFTLHISDGLGIS